MAHEYLLFNFYTTIVSGKWLIHRDSSMTKGCLAEKKAILMVRLSHP